MFSRMNKVLNFDGDHRRIYMLINLNNIYSSLRAFTVSQLGLMRILMLLFLSNMIRCLRLKSNGK